MDAATFLSDAWKQAGNHGTVPEYVVKRFKSEIVPLLFEAKQDDPFVLARLQRLFLDHHLTYCANIMLRNAKSGENLETLVGKVVKAKIFASVGGVGIAGVCIAILIAVVSASIGGLSSQSWNEYRIAAQAEETKRQIERNEFLKEVNKQLMTCVGGEIETRKEGKVTQKRCNFSKGVSWWIE